MKQVKKSNNTKTATIQECRWKTKSEKEQKLRDTVGNRHSLSHIMYEKWFHKTTDSHWLQLAEFTIIFCVKTPILIFTCLWHNC